VFWVARGVAVRITRCWRDDVLTDQVLWVKGMKTFDSPFIVLVGSLVVQWLAGYGGDLLRRKVRPLRKETREDFETVQNATLTLLALIIGFSFAMAVTRYDQRKNYEEAEANAIGTEYVRADLLPAENATGLRELLRKYLDQRILFYLARDEGEVGKIDVATGKLQTELWSAVVRPATTQPTPVIALAVSGMNDVLNAQGYTQAAWWNRIPVAAWALMGLTAVSCSLLFGYGERRTSVFVLILPLIVSISFFLIADLDSPRGGIIHVEPHNLISLLRSMPAH